MFSLYCSVHIEACPLSLRVFWPVFFFCCRCRSIRVAASSAAAAAALVLCLAAAVFARTLNYDDNWAVV